MAFSFAVHATTARKAKRIFKEGLRPQPFWRSRQPVRHPLKIRWRYPIFANSIEGKSLVGVQQAVYDSLRSANSHLTFSEKSRLRIKKLRLLLVDLNLSKVSDKRVRKLNLSEERRVNEVKLEAPPAAIRLVKLSDSELDFLERSTRPMATKQANIFISRFVAEKVWQQLNAKMHRPVIR